MRIFHRFLIAAVATIAAAACSADSGRLTGPVSPPPDDAIAGSWGLDPAMLFPGTEFQMTLSDSSGVVTGVGSFAGEAGPQGALQLSGTVQNDSLHLQVIYLLDPRFGQSLPDTGHLTGVLVARDTLNAAIMNAGSVWSVRLVRLKIGDPPG